MPKDHFSEWDSGSTFKKHAMQFYKLVYKEYNVDGENLLENGVYKTRGDTNLAEAIHF